MSFLLLAGRPLPRAHEFAAVVRVSPWTVGDLVDAFNAGNLLIVMAKVARPDSLELSLTAIPPLLWHYAWFQAWWQWA